MAADPEELTKLRFTYDSAVERAVRPLTETYLKELEKIKTSYIQAGKLEEALRVETEMRVVITKLTAMGAISTSAAGTQIVIDARVTIPPNDPNGYRIGPIRRGDRIMLQYVQGNWKSHGRIATTNPDSLKDENHPDRLVIARAADKGNPGDVIALVPSQTIEKPYMFVAPTTRDDVVLRIHQNSIRKENPGSVIYHLKIVR